MDSSQTSPNQSRAKVSNPLFTTLFVQNIRNTPQRTYSTVTDFARFLGLSTSVPRAQAVW